MTETGTVQWIANRLDQVLTDLNMNRDEFMDCLSEADTYPEALENLELKALEKGGSVSAAWSGMALASLAGWTARIGVGHSPQIERGAR